MKPRARAALLLGAVLLTFVASAVRSSGSASGMAGTPRVADPIVYDRILSRLHAGEPYYAVIGSELRSHLYATREVFNWRTPLLWRGLAPLSPAMRRAGLIAFSAVAAILATLTVLRRVSLVAAVVTGIAALGMVLVASAPGSVAMGEAWAGALVGISVCAYLAGHRRAGFGAALIAMFVRELVAPFTLVCAALALAQRRWRELAAWIAGGAAYAAYYGFHLSQVWAHRLPTDLPGEGSWIAFGGLTFLLTTVQWNGLLLLAPWGAVAAALALIVAGVLSERSPAHLRLGAGSYLVIFLVAGQPFDRYWGLLVWPTWALAVGYGAQAVATAAGVLAGFPSGGASRPPGAGAD